MTQTMSVKRVSPEEAKALMENEGYVYLDVRSIPEFEGGHPVGAYNIPIAHMTRGRMRPNADFLVEVASAFPKDTKLVVGCQMGIRSLTAVQTLMQAGYEKVVDQRAGFDGVRDSFGQLQEAGWQRRGFDVALEAEPGRSYAELTGSGEDD